MNSSICLAGSVLGDALGHHQRRRAAGLGQRIEHQAVGLLQHDPEGLVVHRLEAGDEAQQLQARRIARAPALERGDAVLRRDRLAVVPFEAVAQGEGVGEPVGAQRPSVSTICGCGCELLVHREQRVPHHVAVVAHDVGGGPDRIEDLEVRMHHRLDRLGLAAPGEADGEGRRRRRPPRTSTQLHARFSSSSAPVARAPGAISASVGVLHLGHVLVALGGEPQRVVAELDRRILRRAARPTGTTAGTRSSCRGRDRRRTGWRSAAAPETLRTRCGVDRKRSLVQRCRMSPPFTTKASSTSGASIHWPFGSWIDRPCTLLGGSSVMKPGIGVRHQARDRVVGAVDQRIARLAQDHVRLGEAGVEIGLGQVERQRVEPHQLAAQRLDRAHVLQRLLAEARQVRPATCSARGSGGRRSRRDRRHRARGAGRRPRSGWASCPARRRWAAPSRAIGM